MPNAELIVMGFDFGMKRIGVAVGQTLTQTARPLSMIPATKGIPNWSSFDKLIKEWRPNALVVGIPLNMDGTEQPITHNARQFARQLTERYHLPLHEIDERLTSVAARDHLFSDGGYKALQKGVIDSVAAQLMVESWLTNR